MISRTRGGRHDHGHFRLGRGAIYLVLALLAVCALVIGPAGVASAGSAPKRLKAKQLPLAGAVIEGVKSRVGRIARTDPSLLGRSDSTPVNVVVKFDYDSVATYGGGLSGLPATSPEVTGRELNENAAAVAAYESYVEGVEREITAAIEAEIPASQVIDSFRVAYGGVAMQVPANEIDELLAVDGVVAVQKNDVEQPLTDVTPDFLGASKIWAEFPEPSRAGEGVIVGVLDTGIWPEHPSFADPGIEHPGRSFGCEFGDGSDPLLGPAFACNDKLIGAYAFLNTNITVRPTGRPGDFCNFAARRCSARDNDGHGTHTSSTAAGSPVPSAPVFGVERGPISGMAPGAHVIMYRVCLRGCFQSDSVAAVQQAIRDGVDVLNFSISGGAEAYTDPVELAFLDAYAAGILVNASAGNAGPGPGTANHGGPWVNTVGASTSNRHFVAALDLVADNGEVFHQEGATITAGLDTPTPIIRARDIPGYGDELCQTPVPPGSAAGYVVVCQRGVVGRVEKSYNVLQGGAVGMILYNPSRQGLNTDNHWVPAIHVEGPPTELLAFLESHTGVAASWTTGIPTPVRGDVMTDFSSRGPLGDFLKPDVTAPGIQILAGHSPDHNEVVGGPPGELFQAIAGTSMSAPHAAGVAALVLAKNWYWTPGMLKSALMTSSVQNVLKEDGSTPATPFDRGAGSIRANLAVRPTATFDVDAGEYYRSAGDPLGRVHLNLPSINAPTMPGSITTERTLLNVTEEEQTFNVTTDAPAGVTIDVNPSTFTVPKQERFTFTVTISAPQVAVGQYFGQITLHPNAGYQDVVMPVAFFRRQGQASLQHSCDPTTFPVGAAASCQVRAQNLAPVPVEATLDVRGPDDGGVTIENVSPPGTPSGNGFSWSGTLSPAIAPTIDSLTAGGTGFGYVSLRSLGVTPVSGVGDETIVNFNVPAFRYGSETYTRVGMTSNGYAVVGGGTAQDIDFVPQTLPNPARPNNVLAPFWTDLNPAAGGALLAGLVSESTSGRSFVVLEWENVAVFSIPSERETFQIWLETTAGVERNTFEYGTIVGTGDPEGLNVGAENRDGTSGVNLGSVPASGDAYSVDTSPPTPGGVVDIGYNAVGQASGTFDVVANLTSTAVAGTTTQVVRLNVQ